MGEMEAAHTDVMMLTQATQALRAARDSETVAREAAEARAAALEEQCAAAEHRAEAAEEAQRAAESQAAAATAHSEGLQENMRVALAHGTEQEELNAALTAELRRATEIGTLAAGEVAQLEEELALMERLGEAERGAAVKARAALERRLAEAEAAGGGDGNGSCVVPEAAKEAAQQTRRHMDAVRAEFADLLTLEDVAGVGSFCEAVADLLREATAEAGAGKL